MSNLKLSQIAAPSGLATSAQGTKADTAIQPNDNISSLTNDAGFIDAAGAPVQSVNGETGVVNLDAGDVGAAVVEFYTATVETTDWTGSDPYVAAITVNGLLDTDRPIVDIDLSAVAFGDVEAFQFEWSFIYRVSAQNNQLILFATDNPLVDIDVLIKVTR